MLDRRPALAALFATVALAACGGNSDAPAPAPTPSGPDLTQRTAAATSTAQNNSLCTAIRPFYWEIGDGTQRRASASVNAAGNATTYTANSVMPIASASKWLYGAYVVEQRAGALTASDIQYLTFRSGYTGLVPIGDCQQTDTVASCVARNDNDVQTPAHVGRFYYNGGHMQKHASLAVPGVNLGAMDNAALATEMRRLLGTDIAMSFTQPQPAGGVRTSADDYAIFLRKLLNNQLRLGALLGAHKACTNPATCTDALSSPTPAAYDWNYALGHWVEDDAQTGDGAFSSAGAFGFYPWIDVTKSWYGIVARTDMAGGGNESADCGALIRRAWVSGVAQ